MFSSDRFWKKDYVTNPSLPFTRSLGNKIEIRKFTGIYNFTQIRKLCGVFTQCHSTINFGENFSSLKALYFFVSHFRSGNDVSFQKYLCRARGRLFEIEIPLFRSVGLSTAKKIKEA